DRQTLLAGALCHDLGKLRELSSGLLQDYTTSGRLIGHITLGLELLAPFLRAGGLESHLVEHLKHLVLSHHGCLEFGSPCLPATAEALALHFADNLDAKMNQVAGALEALPEGGEGWSGFEPGLDRRLYRPLPTPGKEPAGAARAGLGPERQDRQCSLLLKE
ncbi:MAG: HD domain-containing protein, partial [Deltaproteobacteria bacterium]|nr:HD domain-containing protein [Deltaproteobacteria bacterium]